MGIESSRSMAEMHTEYMFTEQDEAPEAKEKSAEVIGRKVR